MLGAALTLGGGLNDITDISGNNNTITTDSAGFGNYAFNLIGTDNVISTAGPLALGGRSLGARAAPGTTSATRTCPVSTSAR